MGAELAVMTKSGGTWSSMAVLNNFADTIVAKLELTGDNDKWILFGRVMIINMDSDNQGASALMHNANVSLDTVELWMLEHERQCVTLHAALVVRERETITLECNTYKGGAYAASIVAIKVDDFQIQ
jgi:hypothetical protein